MKRTKLICIARYTPIEQRTSEDIRCMARAVAIAQGLTLKGDLIREPLGRDPLGREPLKRKEAPCQK